MRRFEGWWRGPRAALGILGLLAAWVLHATLSAESGVLRWLELRSELARADARIEALHAEIERLHAESERLDSDEFALERAVREDLGLAAPGQWVLRLPREELSSVRIP